MDTNVVPNSQPIFTNVPMREEQSTRVIQVHSRQILFNTNEVLQLLATGGLGWPRVLQNCIFECCSAYLLAASFFIVARFNAIISMVAFVVVHVTLFLILYAQRQHFTYTKAVHFTTIAQFVGFVICFASLKSSFVENVGLALCCSGWSFSRAMNEMGNQQRYVGKQRFLGGAIRVCRGETLLVLALTASLEVLSSFDNRTLVFTYAIPLLPVLIAANLTKRAACDYRGALVSE